MADPTTTITEIDGSDVATVHPPLLALYVACFSGPPWDEGDDDFTAYETRLRGWASLDGFHGLVAHDPAGQMVGAAYGWSGPPEAHGVRLPGIDAELPFHVADLMVHPDVQRQGLGRTLLDGLVRDRRPALLITHPESVSRQLYDAAGWRVAGTVDLPDSLTWVVYTLD